MLKMNLILKKEDNQTYLDIHFFDVLLLSKLKINV